MDGIRRIRLGDDQYVHLDDLISFCQELSESDECGSAICEAMLIVALSLRYSFLVEA